MKKLRWRDQPCKSKIERTWYQKPRAPTTARRARSIPIVRLLCPSIVPSAHWFIRTRGFSFASFSFHLADMALPGAALVCFSFLHCLVSLSLSICVSVRVMYVYDVRGKRVLLHGARGESPARWVLPRKLLDSRDKFCAQWDKCRTDKRRALRVIFDWIVMIGVGGHCAVYGKGINLARGNESAREWLANWRTA